MVRPGYQSQRGVALVMTLIMLSVITFLTIAFLAISRRDRASVTTSLSQTDSHFMADTALARFQSEVTARMMAQNNLQVYDLMLTRNYFNPTGYVDRGNVIDTNNVNYDYRDDRQPLNNTDWLHNIANLFYDPRPPVFVRTNENRSLPLDFRFYLDYNRNGRFETNGLQPVVIDESGTTNGVANFLGEPEWIGVLQNPEYPHSPTNRFVGRYLYFALPISRTLDLNYIHNDGKGLLDGNNIVSGAVGDGFIRNQGVGSWEINLGAFLEDLNTNIYGFNSTVAYQYFPDAQRNRGDSFSDAVSFLGYRYRGRNDLSTLSSVANLFPGNGVTAFSGPVAFGKDLIDGYSTRPILNTPFVNLVDPDRFPRDLTREPWPGSKNPRQFFDPQDLFDPAKSSANFVTKLRQVSARNNSYDRYTFARLLEQIGTGSEPEVKGKININYVNDPSQNLIATNFAEWTPYRFFTNVATRLIKDNLVTNVIGGNTNIYLFNTNQANLVNTNFSVTNIQIFSKTNSFYNEYTAPLHRLLQVAANIYDSTSSNKFPTIYRPQFRTDGVGTYITNYVVETNSIFLANALTNVIQDRTNVTDPNALVWGIPSVVAAKKGFPNFNEFLLQTSIQVSRNLQLIKQTTNSPVSQTNQMLVLGVSNVFGMEAWNSYIAPYTNRVRLLVTNLLTMALTNETGAIIWPADGKPTNIGVFARPTLNTGWPSGVTSNSFLLPILTNTTFLSNYAYRVGGPVRFVPYTNAPPGGTSKEVYEKGVGYPIPKWVLTITNRLVYALVDTSVALGRVIDFVNLDKMTTTIDITDELLDDDVNSPISEPSRLAGLWVTNRVGNATAETVPTQGMAKQIAISMGSPKLEDSDWASYGSQDPPANKEKAIAEFTKFMGYTPKGVYYNIPMPTELVWQTPFNPTRKLDQTISWQVNDPLVHYMTEDLRDSTNRVELQIRIPPNGPIGIPNNLGKMNERYRPWGRRHGGEGVGPLMSGNATGEFADYAYDFRVKDPRVRWSDDWEFPTNKFPNIGWLGRVHRGTPWQTIYLKSAAIANRVSPSAPKITKPNWEDWSGRMESHPTNDWKLMDMFTVAPNDNAARGLLSVNQTNQAAWSAVLSGVVALTNWQSDAQVSRSERIQGDTNAFQSVVIQPGINISNIVANINAVRATKPNGVFNSLGDILSVPSLSVGYNDFNGVIDSSPYLNVTNYNYVGTNKIIAASAGGVQRNQNQRFYGVNDEAYERLPQQIMSLLKLGEPQFVVYSYGQSLKPAPNSIVLSAPIGSGLFNLCTNYQITGEVVTRTVLHIEPNPDAKHPKTVIDSYNVLPAE